MSYTFGTSVNPSHYIEVADADNFGQVVRPDAGLVVKVKAAPTLADLPDVTTGLYGHLPTFTVDVPEILVSADEGATWIGPLQGAEALTAAISSGTTASSALAAATAAGTAATTAQSTANLANTKATDALTAVSSASSAAAAASDAAEVAQDVVGTLQDTIAQPGGLATLGSDGLLVVSQRWATGGGGGGSGGGLAPTWRKTVAGSAESADVKAAADYVCDGTSDQVQINAALAAVGAEAINYGGNGGEVLLVGRRFNCDGPVLLQSQTHLRGVYGSNGTWIYRSGTYAPGAQGGMVQLASVNTQYARLSDVAIHGGNASVCGVYIGVGAAQEWDSFIRLHDLFIINAGQSGIRWDNISGGRCRGNMTERIRVLNAGVDGFYINAPDSFFHMLDTGSAGRYGFNLVHSNNRITDSKAWFSDSHGFSITAGRDNSLSACESQDNYGHGFLVNSQRTGLVGCCADSNGYNGDLTANGYTGSGFYVGGNGFSLAGCTASDKNEGGRGTYQQYGFRTVGAIKGAATVTTSGNAIPSSFQAAGDAGSVINIINT
jgi:hypothetical protein